MTGEQFLKAVLNAPPGTRSKIEMLLNGDESVVPSPIADARTCTQAEAARRLGVSRQTVVGWKPLGRSLEITRADGPILYELDGKPAFSRYKHYLGLDDEHDFEESSLIFPFVIDAKFPVKKDEESPRGRSK